MKSRALITSACALALTVVSSAAPNSVVIAKGDTLYSIARQHNTTPSALMKANGIADPSSIAIGTRLSVPTAASKAKAATKKAAAPARLAPGSSYTVKQGDTLYGISRSLGISVSDLKAANPGIDATSMATGTVLKTTPAKASAKKATPPPAPKKVEKAVEKKVKRAEKPAPRKKENTQKLVKQQADSSADRQASRAETTPPKPVKKTTESLPEPKFESRADAITSVRIRKAMTYGQVAATHSTSVERLNKLNGLRLTRSTLIAQGAELYVPR